MNKFDALSALFGASLALIISWLGKRYDLSLKKRIIDEDLIHQFEVLQELERAINELIGKFESRNIQTHASKVFEDMYTDVYESLTKPELYKIYKRKMPLIITIYKTIYFLQSMSIHKIYRNYLDFWNEHSHSSDHKSHEHYCSAHVFYIDNTAVSQLKSNLETISELKRQINSALNYKFYYLSPF